MKVELGNPAVIDRGVPQPGAAVTYFEIPDSYTCKDVSLQELSQEFIRAAAHPNGLQLPDHEALVAIIHRDGAWNQHHAGNGPTWVWSDNPVMERLLSEFFQVPAGRPADVEQTHGTSHDGIYYPAGQAPAASTSVPEVAA